MRFGMILGRLGLKSNKHPAYEPFAEGCIKLNLHFDIKIMCGYDALRGRARFKFQVLDLVLKGDV